MKHLLVVYGSLRSGFPLSNWIDYLKVFDHSREEVELSGLKIFVMGMVPAAKLTGDPKDKVVAEIVEADIDDERWETFLKILDQVEGVDQGLYERSTINTPKGEAVIYTFASEIPEGAVPIYDWAEWSNRPEAEKLEFLKNFSEGSGIYIS